MSLEVRCWNIHPSRNHLQRCTPLIFQSNSIIIECSWLHYPLHAQKHNEIEQLGLNLHVKKGRTGVNRWVAKPVCNWLIVRTGRICISFLEPWDNKSPEEWISPVDDSCSGVVSCHQHNGLIWVDVPFWSFIPLHPSHAMTAGRGAEYY